MLLYGSALDERSSDDIKKYGTFSFKYFEDNSHIIYSSGKQAYEIESIFVNRLILSRGRLLLTRPRSFKLNIIGYLDLVTLIEYLARSLSFGNDIKRLVVYVRTLNRFQMLYGVQRNRDIMMKDEVRNVNEMRIRFFEDKTPCHWIICHRCFEGTLYTLVQESRAFRTSTNNWRLQQNVSSKRRERIIRWNWVTSQKNGVLSHTNKKTSDGQILSGRC